jgi:hypothetical protein
MLLQFKVTAIRLLVASLVVAAGQLARAQQAPSKAPPKAPAKAAAPAGGSAPAGKSTAKSASAPAAKPAPSRAPLSAEETAKKAAILDSKRWRRAMFELNEWLSAQRLYDKKQVEEIKADLSTRVAEMSSSDLEFMLQDMEAKFQIMDSQPAQEAREWLGHYLSLRSAKKREEILKDLPNLVTMTAAQLSQEIQKIERKRTLSQREAAASSRTQQALVSSQMQANQAAQQAARRQQNRGPDTYTSPYRAANATPGERPFDDRKIGPSMEFYSGNFGQFGVVFNPSSY